MITEPGAPAPFGASLRDGRYNFAVLAEHAEQVFVCLYDETGLLHARLPLQATGHIWHIATHENISRLLYCYEVHRGTNKLWLSDPFAHNLNLLHRWRQTKIWPAPVAGITSADFDWQDDRLPSVGLPETVIYEAHVKGLTVQFSDIPDAIRGTYLGVCHKSVIRHLKSLGVTTLELLPVHAKSEDPFLAGKGLTNYWGYNTLNYFSPESAYASADAVTEFKTMVRELHRAGIEVILDVVYNHTGEGGHNAKPVSFRGLAETTYYLTDHDGKYIDYTHCGNTLNCAHPHVREMILESLRYWAGEMHVDGFRFDLAPTLFRKDGAVTFDNDLHRAIAGDELLKNCKLIVEPWDPGHEGYCRGKFPKPYLEWNDVFRDTARRFWKGEPCAAELGKLMIHRGRPVINFITCHDGFTLRDVVSYEHKHNAANGEHNRDGSNHNHSFNCGTEGDTSDAQILKLRNRQSRNLLATLFWQQDIPMLLAGDEFGNSQHGNNNAYCQDNEISWLNWGASDDSLTDFARQAMSMRKGLLAANHPHLIEAPTHPAHAFGINLERYIVLLNASQENVLFPLQGMRLREILHTARPAHADELHDICFVSAQSIVLLQRII